MQAAPKEFSQKTVSGIKNNKVLFPPSAVTCQTSGYHLAAAPFPWARHCMPASEKAELASHQCTKAEVQEVRIFWVHFPWSRAQEDWGLQMDCHSSSLSLYCPKGHQELTQLEGHTPAGHSSLTHLEFQPREQQGTMQVRRRPEFPVFFFQQKIILP